MTSRWRNADEFEIKNSKNNTSITNFLLFSALPSAPMSLWPLWVIHCFSRSSSCPDLLLIFFIDSPSSFFFWHQLLLSCSSFIPFLVCSAFPLLVSCSPLYELLSWVQELCHFILWFLQIPLCFFSFWFFTSSFSSHFCKSSTERLTSSWKKLELCVVFHFVLLFLSLLYLERFWYLKYLPGVPRCPEWISGIMSPRWLWDQTYARETEARNHDLLQAEKDSLYTVFNCDPSNALHTEPQDWQRAIQHPEIHLKLGEESCASASPLLWRTLQVLQHAWSTSNQKPTPALMYIFVVTLASNSWMAVLARTPHSSPRTPQMNCLDFGCRHLFSARYSTTHVRDRREANGWHWVGAPAVKWSVLPVRSRAWSHRQFEIRLLARLQQSSSYYISCLKMYLMVAYGASSNPETSGVKCKM